MSLLAVLGLDSDLFDLTVNLVLLFLVVLWIALIYYTYSDAKRRIADPLLVMCATAASLFPFAGTIVYMIVRPPEYLEDVRERELEMQAAEARLHAAGYYLCPHCDSPIERDYLTCPTCMRKLKEPCLTCQRPIDPGWKLCPYCEAEVGVAPPPRRTRRRRATTDEAAAAEAEPAPRRRRTTTDQPAAAEGEAAPKRRRSSTSERAAARPAPPTS